jgi:tRNA(Ile2)-agmatinylcytidine synthase
MYLAFDDTDSVQGMCTTFLATEMVREFQDYDLIGLPRLVRLNPAVPWKTRGNAALCLRFGRGGGGRRLIGRMGDSPIFCFDRILKQADGGELLSRGAEVMERWSRVEEEASPGLVVSAKPPRPSLYWSTVRGVVAKEEVEAELRKMGGRTHQLAGGRGIIGASAAMAWRPRDRTYEVLVYRAAARWGSPREVSPEDVAWLDRRFPTTFNNYDTVAHRTAIVPHSPCPILFGIRGDDPQDLVEAIATIRSEEKDRWLLFLSNQGTDDHIIKDWSTLQPGSSYLVKGKVLERPRTIMGGHVVFRLGAKKGLVVDCAAYEPSMSVRATVRQLVPGDEVEVMGELRGEPRSLNLEKVHVLRLAEEVRKVSNPLCPACGKRMQSLGRGAGYRCRQCRTKAEGTEIVTQPVCRALSPGWYEPPVCARRHISKPLKRTCL